MISEKRKETQNNMEELKQGIRDIPNFPKEGIIFKDITPLLKNPALFKKAIDALCEHYKNKNINTVISIESRGFIFGSVIAYNLGASFVPVRKKGKLPHDTQAVTYELEYGQDTLEIHKDAVSAGDRVLIIDDLLATGGTIGAVVDLVENLGAEVAGIGFLIELTFLKGREKKKGYDIFSLIKY